jgi:subtilisin family serine protease
MKKSIIILFAFACLLLLSAKYSNLYAVQNSKSFVIKLKSVNDKTVLQPIIQRNNLSLREPFAKPVAAMRTRKTNSPLSVEADQQLKEIEKYVVIYLPANANAEQIESDIRNLSGIDNITPNYIYSIEDNKSIVQPPNDPDFKRQWGLVAVDALQAWEKSTGKNVRVGVIDTGIDFTHPEFQGQFWINPAEDINHDGIFEPWPSTEFRNGVSGDLDGIDQDGNGYVDDVIGYDFVDQSIANVGDATIPDPIPLDENGHGTLVSGVIAAKANNNFGGCGLAFDSKIVMLRSFDMSGNAESDDIAAAIVYAAVNHIPVINMSFGEESNSPIMEDAIKLAYSMGCFMVASSGNNGWQYQHYPSDYPQVFSVGSSMETGKRDSRSNYGSHLALLAPGTNIVSTSLGGDMRTADGTSMSAPFVSATAALLLGIDSTLTPQDINGILLASAQDCCGNTWNILDGAGVVNAGAAVNLISRSNFGITSPTNEAGFDREKIQKIPVLGSVIVPLFDGYQLFIGKGITPSSWDTLSPYNTKQVLNGILATIDTAGLVDTTYTIRLSVMLKSGKTLEKRIFIDVFSGSTSLRNLTFNLQYVWKDDARAAVITTISNQPAEFSVKFRRKDSNDPYIELKEDNLVSHYHIVMIQKEMIPGVDYDAISKTMRSDGTILETSMIINIPTEIMPSKGYTVKNYSLPFAYIFPEVTDLYGDGKQCVILNEMPDGAMQNTKIFSFDGTNFIVRDSIYDVWLPAGTGDSNGDGIKEIFAKSAGKSVLFQAKEKGGNPFEQIIFEDTTSFDFWAAAMVDLDGDGKEELIAYSDTTFFVYSYKQGRYQQIANTSVPGRLKSIGTLPGYAVGDFDNDGKIELFHSNLNGNLFIHKFVDGKFTLVYEDSTNYSNSGQYVVSGDFDGDGRPEILIADAGSTPLFGQEDVAEPIWTYRIIKSFGVNQYTVINQDMVYGVRAGVVSRGVSYRNGVAAGNLDGKKGDEIIFSPFPNLYVFKWNAQQQAPIPFLWQPSAFTNAAIIYDFDKNGINELGYSSGDKITFIEYDSSKAKLQTPTGFDGWATSDSTTYLHWNSVVGADSFKIYGLRWIDNQTIDFGSTTQTNIIIDSLAAKSFYSFVVVAASSLPSILESDPTYSVDVFTHNPIYPIRIVASNDRKILNVVFDGKLISNSMEPGYFKLTNTTTGDVFNPNSALIASDSTAVLTFPNQIISGNYDLSVISFRDFYHSPSLAFDTLFTISEQPTLSKEMILARIDVKSSTSLVLTYSESVDPASALTNVNYSLTPFGKVINVIINGNNADQVLITLDPSQPLIPFGKMYELFVTNVNAVSGNQIAKGPGGSISFLFNAGSLSDAYVYPNPIKLNEHPQIIFAGLTNNSEITIMSLEGEVVAKISNTGGTGGVEWDGRNTKGDYVNSGVYLFKVEQINPDGSTGESELKKFVVIR